MTLAKLYSQHIARLQAGYEAALTRTKFDAVVLHAGHGLQQRLVDDQYWPLKVNPSFAHWLPLLEDNALVVVVPGDKPKLVQTRQDNVWEGPPPVPGDHFWEAFDVVKCLPDDIKAHCPGGTVAFVGDVLSAAETMGIAPEHRNPPALMREFDALRSLKSAYEVECMAQATRIAIEGHIAIDSEFHRGHPSELDLHLHYLKVTRQDSTETPYGNIVAQGAHASLLHHVHYTRDAHTKADESLLVDAGANYMGYASDITRTTVRGESQAARDFRALIAGMEALELEVVAEVKPGIDYQDLHNQCHYKLAAVLLECGLCAGPVDALVEQGVTRTFLPHGLGHSLGLQVHDVGCKLVPPADANPFLRNTSTITEGQVFTIEPGCYFIDGLLAKLRNSAASALVSWESIEALRPFGGIRIEDNLAVTAQGSINLTRDNWPAKH